ncbi:hypothetical protein MMC30_006523 [Trapelia coarctata]|nr:hypothetical protein [Trapelia coarctata]
MSTIDAFLTELNQILRAKNGAKLQDYLVIEPPFSSVYSAMVAELRQNFPSENQDALEVKCKQLLPEDDESGAGGSWTAFISFLVQYFAFIRDVNVDHLMETHDMLKALLNQCVLALSDASMGIVVLPTVISLSRTLVRLAIGLDKRPELREDLRVRASRGVGEEVERVTLVESSANVIREAFKKCLGERDGNPRGLDANGKPAGRRVGIYILSNLCMKIFFHTQKIRNCEQIFSNINDKSPPLSTFPASQRVTHLYYLGRYHFYNKHFYRAMLSLQAAYDQCHKQAIKQRHLILRFLISSNLILGRFPSQTLLQRPEAAGLGDEFLPICWTIKRGDLKTFRELMDYNHKNASWFLQRRVFLQIRNTCDIAVWRSLARRTFLVAGSQPSAASGRPPTLNLQDLLTLGRFLGNKDSKISPAANEARWIHHCMDINSQADQREGEEASQEYDQEHVYNTRDSQENGYDAQNGEANGNGTQNDQEYGNDVEESVENGDDEQYDSDELWRDKTYEEEGWERLEELEQEPGTIAPRLLSIQEVESTMASLIHQDLAHGYLSHKFLRFVITGAKGRSPAPVGFPPIWHVVAARCKDEVVPGWVGDEDRKALGRPTVVNLKGARPAGAAPDG